MKATTLSMRLALVLGLALALNVAHAQAVMPDTVEAHLAAGKRAVGGTPYACRSSQLAGIVM